jgi:serine/threonine-protein kinase
MKRARRIGRYHVLDRVSSGGMADVYRAKTVDAEGVEHLVALKRVLEMYAEDPSFVKMLVAEYRLTTLLRHPNIARVLELLRTPEGYFIVMEYVDGKDLRSSMHKARELGHPFDVADAAYLMARAVDGLEHAHVATTEDERPLRLVHRDLSPSNVLVGYDGSVKIIDFGIAKADVERERTAVGIIKGKVRYMSPEQAQGEQQLTGQSDVFSAGSVLYELLTGQPAFTAQSEVELIYAVRRAQPAPLEELAPQVPEPLVAIVKTAMARAKKDRFPSAAAFRDALVTFLRTWSPGYRRTRLANTMKTLWSREIEREIQTLLEFAMSDSPETQSEDLLASVSVEDSLRDLSSSLDLGDAGATLTPVTVKPLTEPPLVPQGGEEIGFVPPPDDLFAAEYAAYFNKRTVPAPRGDVADASSPDTVPPDRGEGTR